MTTAIVIASGPSLDKVYFPEAKRDLLRATMSKHDIFVVNNAYELVPRYEHHVALDQQWWEHYKPDDQGALRWDRNNTVTQMTNSGLAAIDIAAGLGYDRILLLGFDFKRKHMAHFFGDHPPGFINAGIGRRWHKEANLLKEKLIGKEIINCTPDSALRCWPHSKLEEVI